MSSRGGWLLMVLTAVTLLRAACLGGHLEKHESWRTCATRELKEETDLEIPEDSMSFVWVDNSDMPEEAKHYTTIFLLAPLPEGSSPPQNMEPNKCDGWEWISWIDLQKRAAAVSTYALGDVVQALSAKGISLSVQEPTSLFIPLLNCLTKGCDPFNVPGGKFSSDAFRGAATGSCRGIAGSCRARAAKVLERGYGPGSRLGPGPRNA
eukprot:scaffold1272_cov250-Pinguiococcus_pyrenoidosus.AAC.77